MSDEHYNPEFKPRLSELGVRKLLEVNIQWWGFKDEGFSAPTLNGFDAAIWPANRITTRNTLPLLAFVDVPLTRRPDDTRSEEDFQRIHPYCARNSWYSGEIDLPTLHAAAAISSLNLLRLSLESCSFGPCIPSQIADHYFSGLQKSYLYRMSEEFTTLYSSHNATLASRD